MLLDTCLLNETYNNLFAFFSGPGIVFPYVPGPLPGPSGFPTIDFQPEAAPPPATRFGVSRTSNGPGAGVHLDSRGIQDLRIGHF